ncbi:response regulator transcription factor [Anaerosalibacter bizertensis]|uniref:Response regulator transcription factor n=1 Tax=Anaerosalibacter bizertensis TaxID=932217 RepID=A0A9Q4ADE9_9FIRM|nr:response regulator transcription factor [Bacteroidales bacterium MSK.15.36]MCB5560233.1 response regulator transcription factor [Anaerosalibacter bizertensis]MCG4565858.1 response regulator transcription factor [Anaerosalibacter bizertensis]MCG4583126.1 response regulator transcription factor [Anaerosalibacter bizertensis]MCG4585968.1 response regulator transcription factor [Anaerosalibacter bizertensis]
MVDTKILIVDDEKLFVKGLKYSLEQDDYIIETAFDGKEAIEKVKKKRYDLIILDLMLPGIDGLEVCQKIRQDSQVPIIMLTARGEDINKILGLEYGADDYLTKPFNILELKARIKAILRRVNMKSTNITDQVIQIDDFKINTLGRKLTIHGNEVNLTAKEFDLLLLLASNPGKVFTREELLETIWGYEYFGDLRTVDVHIRRLREKIEEDSGQPEYILTKWGVGYYFRSKPQ